jgi:hypothetical protein
MRAKLAVTLMAAAAALGPAHAQQAPTFKSNVNMLAVDALVIDRQGTPILGLLPDDFSVTVNNQPRRVVSATLVQYGGSVATSAGSAITSPISLEAVRTPGRVPDDGRVFIIAVDEPSFLTGDMRAAVLAAQRFIRNLRPTDMVGAYMFPFSTPTWSARTCFRSPRRCSISRTTTAPSRPRSAARWAAAI